MQAKPSLEDTLALMRDLRARCEWDAAQTHDSLRPYLVEEAAELDEAIRVGADPLVRQDAIAPSAPVRRQGAGTLGADEGPQARDNRRGPSSGSPLPAPRTPPAG